MKKEELFSAIGEVDEQKVVAARRAMTTSKKSHSIWLKWGALAVCLCLVIASALVMKNVWNNPNAVIPNINISGTPTVTNETNQMAAIGNEPSPDIAPDISTEPPYSGPVNGLDNQEILNVKPMISNYGENTSNIDMAVNNGSIYISEAPDSAMRDYGETVNYRVLIELFHDGVQISSGDTLALEEAQRLSELGYIVAMETYTEKINQGEYLSANVNYHFTIHATYGQLKDFSASDTLGYSLMLYDEYLGRPSSLDTIVYQSQT